MQVLPLFFGQRDYSWHDGDSTWQLLPAATVSQAQAEPEQNASCLNGFDVTIQMIGGVCTCIK